MNQDSSDLHQIYDPDHVPTFLGFCWRQWALVVTGVLLLGVRWAAWVWPNLF